MAIALVLISLANIALPLTNGFVGEFMLFNGLFSGTESNHVVIMVVAGLGVILGAVYTLNMVQKVAYGNVTKMVVTNDLSVSHEIIGSGQSLSVLYFSLGFIQNHYWI